MNGTPQNGCVEAGSSTPTLLERDEEANLLRLIDAVLLAKRDKATAAGLHHFLSKGNTVAEFKTIVENLPIDDPGPLNLEAC